ncbi:YcxB family protein [Acetobacteraceae bacterium H6797]|nr:YcxB family protein [Acetobacteraceae bacterium H6797]
MANEQPPPNPWRGSVPSIPRAVPEQVGSGSAPTFALDLTITKPDELEAQQLTQLADARGPFLGGAFYGFLVMLIAVVLSQLDRPLWKGSYPHGGAFLSLVGCLLAGACLGWVIEGRLIVWMRRRILQGALSRLLGGNLPPLAARVTLGPNSIRWEDRQITRRYEATMIRAVVESDRLFVLRLGFASYLIFPRRNLSPAQVASLRDWVAAHARESGR